jgi:two-component system, chemotaxis family, chemotaxis protein CheY
VTTLRGGWMLARPGAAPSAEDLIAHCRSVIASYKKPRSVEFVEALPRSFNGKVDKTALRAPFWTLSLHESVITRNATSARTVSPCFPGHIALFIVVEEPPWTALEASRAPLAVAEMRVAEWPPRHGGGGPGAHMAREGRMRVLLVDDDQAVRESIALVLTGAGFTVEEAGNGMEAMRRLGEQVPDLVVTDILMPQKEGIECIREIRGLAPNVPVIAMSGGGGGQADYLRMAALLGAAAVLAKPFDPMELVELARRLVATPAGDARLTR